MTPPTFSLKNLRAKATTLFTPPAPTPGPSVVGTLPRADVGDVVRLPSSPANAGKEGNAKPSKGILCNVFMSDASASGHVCGVKCGVGTSICIDVDCKVVAHQGKFCHVLPNRVYVKKNNSTAFLEPSADISNLAPESRLFGKLIQPHSPNGKLDSKGYKFRIRRILQSKEPPKVSRRL